VVLLDDVITSGESLLRGWEICKQYQKLAVVRAIVVVDRQEGGVENCAAEGLEVESLFTVDEILEE
jgi:orotate phosphoribosyltransferase